MEQAVIAHLSLKDDPFGSEREREIIIELAEMLHRAIDEQGVGEFDGEEFGGGRCVLYMYGPDADRLFGVVEPILKSVPLSHGGFAIKRYGDAADLDALESKVQL